MRPYLIRGMKSREEIEKIIVDYLVVKKNNQDRLICENNKVEEILVEVAERLTKVVYPNKMKY